MLGAIIGDIAGSVYEFANIKTKDFPFLKPNCRFTDDSVMTAAVAKACIEYVENHNIESFESNVIKYMQSLGREYLDVGYGARFHKWILADNPKPYNSYGNGSAMRVSSTAYISHTLDEAEYLAEISARVTHNHPEGIKGARAVSAAVYMALNGNSKSDIKEYIENRYYNINFTLDEIRESYAFDVSCQGSVPQALEAFFEADDFEDAIRGAISIGGDSDTIACIAGAVAEGYYGIPKKIESQGLAFIEGTRIIEIYDNFIKCHK